jgi:hypothetical protein
MQSEAHSMTSHPSIMELCHVVRDMDTSIHHWIDVMGAGPFFVVDLSTLPRGVGVDMPVKMAFSYCGALLIELLQPVGPGPSIFHEVLQQKGEGYHHVMLRMDYDRGQALLSGQGYPVGTQGLLPTGERFALYDSRRDNGGFIEIMDLSDNFLGMLSRVEQAHRNWDRTEPVRPLVSVMS